MFQRFVITAVFLILSLTAVLCLQVCDDIGTEFTINEKGFNVNHLKNHLPPYQSYKEKGNIFGKHDTDKNSYVFFNLADVIYKQKVDNDHKIEANCQPRSIAAVASINTPVACIPESNPSDYCIDQKFCWVAIGSCRNVTYSFIDESNQDSGIYIVYTAGDFPAKKFQIKIACCKSGKCIEKAGLDTPVSFKTDGCDNNAEYCVEMSSPYGCDCESRAALDSSLGKNEFHCDATPKGIVGGTSTGTWLLIFLMVGIIAYLGIGIGYNYSEGRRGEEMLPHLDMWKDLGGLIYDGFKYVTSCGEYREGVQYDTIG